MATKAKGETYNGLRSKCCELGQKRLQIASECKTPHGIAVKIWGLVEATVGAGK